MSRSTRRAVVILAATVVAIVVLALVLFYVPLESSSFAQTLDSSRECAGSAGCSQNDAVFILNDNRYATLSGTWETNESGQGVLVTINNGGSNQACSVCAGQLYSSNGTSSGSFDVSGIGPFHISVFSLENGAEATSFQGTLDSAVI